MTTAEGTVRINSYTVKRKEKKKVNKWARYVVAALSVVFIFVAIVAMTAKSADLQARNNELEQANANLQAEIDSLNTQIGDVTNIEREEELATKEYKMVQPNADNYVAVSEEITVDGDLAATIKDEAYN